MFQEFLFAVNIAEKKIEIKHFAGMARTIKVVGEDIVGNKFVWDVFMNCKNDEVLKELDELIIILHFHCATTCEDKVKKSKATSLMTKIEKHLRDGYKRSNYRILKAALRLLKEVIFFAKHKQLMKPNSASHFKYTHKIKFDGKLILI